jgi:hypothetical protein
MHSVIQMGHGRSTSYGDTQLKTPDAQERELVNQALTLFFSSLLPLVGHGYLGCQLKIFSLAASLA